MAEEWTTLGVRITKGQKREIEEAAGEYGMTVSEYVKARLLLTEYNEEDIKPKTTGAEKWMIKALCCLLVNNSKVSEKILGQGSDFTAEIEKLMKRNRFLEDEDLYEKVRIEDDEE